jgi:hypothetical protein
LKHLPTLLISPAWKMGGERAEEEGGKREREEKREGGEEGFLF